MIFQTISGSTYELDLEGKKIRRMEGIIDPTPRQGVDGEWRTFETCSEVVVGQVVLIVWKGIKSTVTSNVAMIHNSPTNLSN